MVTIFWTSLFLVMYPYLVYPGILMFVNRLLGRGSNRGGPEFQPSVSIVLPVHNEGARIGSKVKNLLELDYPPSALQIIVVGDGCTDESLRIAAETGGGRVETIDGQPRRGKAASLNAALQRADGDIVVFTDVGVMLEPDSLRALVAHFADPTVGCVSGEDHIEGVETEGLYGRVELALRREEAQFHSIAGASGCFYGQRRELIEPFPAGMAPDFLSVIETVKKGYRALAEPSARGTMTATASARAEFARKVRTFQRGITALLGNAEVLNPFRYPRFSFIMWSHKMLRWLAPVALACCLMASASLTAEPLYLIFLVVQVLAYGLALAALRFPGIASRAAIIRVCAFFLLVNLAALKALVLWASGARIEVWEPTRRPG